jgi:hypothetical protein
MIDRFGSDPANMIVQLSPRIRPPHTKSISRRNCPAMSRAWREGNSQSSCMHRL